MKRALLHAIGEFVLPVGAAIDLNLVLALILWVRAIVITRRRRGRKN